MSVNEFCHKYEAKITKSSRMHERTILRSNHNFSDSIPPATTTLIEDVSCVEIHMPVDRFKALVEHDRWLQTAGSQDGCADYFSKALSISKQYEQEARIRQSNPTIQAVYDEYQSLLKLVKSSFC